MERVEIGKRIKENYEGRYKFKLLRRTPVIIRLDGNCFHTLTKDCNKPFDIKISLAMEETARYLCGEIQGARCAYVQSDEISLLLTDFEQLDTTAWFDYSIQKMTSISSGKASVFFTKYYGRDGIFDSRVFNIPVAEVCNYFIWRQVDWERNSLMMYALSLYPHEELQKKSKSALHELIHRKGHNWANLEDRWKNGIYIEKVEDKWITCDRCPSFRTERDRIEKFLNRNV
ncbi:MAG: tRNA(His) guanylyltransferase Thg1 family protein [Candidatus Eremiobacterota bacterium]